MRYSLWRYPNVEVNMRLVVMIAAFPAEGQPSCEPEVFVVVSLTHSLTHLENILEGSRKIAFLDPLR